MPSQAGLAGSLGLSGRAGVTVARKWGTQIWVDAGGEVGGCVIIDSGLWSVPGIGAIGSWV